MKKYTLYIIAALLITLASCNKYNENTGTSEYESFLIGQWVSENWDTLEFINESLILYNLSGKTDLFHYSISNDTFYINPTATSSYIPAEEFWKISVDQKKNQFSLLYNDNVNPIFFKKLD